MSSILHHFSRTVLCNICIFAQKIQVAEKPQKNYNGLLAVSEHAEEINQDLTLQKDMVSFIYQHYPEKISLNDIAAAGHVGRSKCCQIFKHYMQQSPVDFLNAYRLKISCQLLCTTQKSITEIAMLCGFNHLSYFSKYFAECYGCIPREYRILHKHETLLT